MAAANTIVTIPHIVKNPGFTTKDFTSIGEMARSPSLLVVAGASEFRSIADLVTAAKKNPGRVNYASGGQGTTSHLPVELFARQAGIALSHIPYKGVSPAVPDLVGGRVGFMMSTPTSVEELMKTGALRALAITSDTRSPKFPDVPTFKELGYPDATFDIWVGLLAPAGIPKAARARLGEAMEFARADQGLVRQLAATGQVISNVRTPDQFEKLLRDEEQRYRQLVKDANITAG
jgi:tripartite-type tricarboxylate transporter receptor subunit TctC